MTTKASELNPKRDLSRKNNFQRFILIDENGETIERVILKVPNITLREEIISIHFLSRYICWFIQEDIGANLVSRDNPWDFEWELSNSEKIIIEITSISEDDNQFRKYKSEERLFKNLDDEHISLRELEKVIFNFPNEQLNEKIDFYKSIGKQSDDLVENPYFKAKNLLFISKIEKDIEGLDAIVKQAIDKKVTKRHSNKEDVILIIDNRTVTFQIESLEDYFEKLNEYLRTTPFKEIWFYTGYYSDNDGSNAEFSFVPLKISDQKLQILHQIVNK